MRRSLLLGAAGLAAAIPAPTVVPNLEMDLTEILQAPKPSVLGAAPDVYSSTTSYVASTATAVVAATGSPAITKLRREFTLLLTPATPLDKRDGDATPEQKQAQKCADTQWDCCPLPTGLETSGDASAFLSNSTWSTDAKIATTPSGYTNSFFNLQGSVQQIGYRGVYTIPDYDPSKCAAYCDTDDLCAGFNIYVERDPVIRPDYDVCKNPNPTANVKCTLYGYQVSNETATNIGQYQSDFHVVIAGSNGYNKDSNVPPARQPGYNGPSELLPGAIQDDSYYLYQFFNDGPFDAAVCAKGCNENTIYNSQHLDSNGKYVTCELFNVYVLYKDNQAQGTVCSFYASQWDPSQNVEKATNVGQWQGDVHVTIGESYVYTIAQ